jgi:hypothetical protein
VAEVLIVSRTRMQTGLCIGAIDLATNASLRLLPAGQHAQPETSPLQIGDIWDVTYQPRNSDPPFVEDVNAVINERRGEANVEASVVLRTPIVVGDTTMLHNGLLHWNANGKGFVEPDCAPPFSTQFWRPTGILFRNDGFKEGSSVFREPATNHKIPWVGVAAPPARIPGGTLVRVSLGRPWSGTEDHPVCWLQVSGVY